jgi:hypothetical protein
MVHGSHRARTFTSHPVLAGGFFFIAHDVVKCLPTKCRMTFRAVEMRLEATAETVCWGNIIPLVYTDANLN